MEKQKSKIIWNIIFTIITIVIFMILVFRLCFVQVIISGNSMEPTLNGSIEEGYDIGYMLNPSLKRIKRFDVVAAEVAPNENWIKRVVALPNEKIAYIDGKLYINDEYVQEPFTKNDNPNLNVAPIVLDSDQYFIIGDNRMSSASSTIKKENIFGVSGFIYSQCGYIDASTGKCKDRCGIQIRGIK